MHAGRQRDLLGFATCHQALVEGVQDGIMAYPDQRRHIQRGSHLLTSSPDGATAPPGPTVAVEQEGAMEVNLELGPQPRPPEPVELLPYGHS